MRRGSNDVARVTLGSVKSCYGHTEGTAGLTGALLAMQTLIQQVGTSHAEKVSPLSGHQGACCEAPSCHADWPADAAV
jgi:3-oxoacyl-(acyl-carrier-protein) synthase